MFREEKERIKCVEVWEERKLYFDVYLQSSTKQKKGNEKGACQDYILAANHFSKTV